MSDADPPNSPSANSPPRMGRVALTALAGGLALALDLASKAWAWEHLRNRPPMRLVPGVFHFDFGFNTGAAFGTLADASWARAFFIVITFVAVAVLTRMAITLPTKLAGPFVAMGLVMGGALGNLHDRLFRSMFVFDEGVTRHGVVDFIVFFYGPGRQWPAFNIADAALLVGVALLLWTLRKVEPVDEAP